MAARARKKTAPTAWTQATREFTWGRLEVLVSFNGLRVGDFAQTEIDDTVRGWVSAGLVRIEHTWSEGGEGGEDQVGPGEPEPDVQGSGEA